MTDALDHDGWTRARELFERALDERPADAEAWLATHCDDEHVRHEVLSLLDEATHPWEGFMQSPSRHELIADDAPAPTRIGHYTLAGVVGSGGMGTVYAAEQDAPRRRVALKVMRLGPGSDALRRRFEVEAEVLAQLDHPAIAKIHEAGVDSDPALGSRAWIAMEFVEDAVTITEWCTSRGLDRAARLALFLAVCDAIQHAHTRGVTHRDIKPANVLVDGTGTPKVIDFGVARIADAQQAGQAAHTRTGQILGTVGAMSPEQMRGDPRAVDTRSDVYSLGVLLYELLCGRPPYDLDGLSLLAAAKVIQETEPTRPARVVARLAGDLDWILLRAMDKQPDARYATAGELAADLRRHLAHEIVLAGPPSAAAAARKFLRRHRLAVATALLVLLALLFGLVRSELQRQQTEAQARRAEFVRDFLLDMLRSPDPSAAGRDVRMLDVLQRSVAQLESNPEGVPRDQAVLHGALAQTYESLGMYSEALHHVEQARRLIEPVSEPDDAERLELQLGRARILLANDRPEQALVLLDDMLELSTDPSRSTAAEVQRVHALLALGETASAETDGRQALRRACLHAPEQLPRALAALSRCLSNAGRADEAIELQRQELALEQAAGGEGSAAALLCTQRLIASLLLLERLDEARELANQTLDALQAALGEQHPDLLSSLDTLAVLAHLAGDYAEAAVLQQRAAELLGATLGPDHDRTLTAVDHLAALHQQRGELQQAEALHRRVLERRLERHGEEHLETLTAMNNLASVLRQLGRLDEAESWARRGRAASLRHLGEDHPSTLSNAHILGQVLLENGQADEAEPLLREALDARRARDPEGVVAHLRLEAMLARAVRTQERIGEAVALFEGILARERELLPAGHLQRLATIGNLAETLLELSDDAANARAVALLEELLADFPDSLARDHPVRLTSLSNLALAREETGALAAALPASDEAADGLLRSLGGEHHLADRVARVRTLLLFRAVQADELLPVCERALALEDDGLHPRTLAWHLSLADRLRSLGRGDEADALRELTLARLAGHPSAEPAIVGDVLLVHAQSYSREGRMQDAQVVFGVAVEVLEGHAGLELAAARALVGRGISLYVLEQQEQARVDLARCLGPLAGGEDDDRALRQMALQLLATIDEQAGRSEDAERWRAQLEG